MNGEHDAVPARLQFVPVNTGSELLWDGQTDLRQFVEAEVELMQIFTLEERQP